MGDRLATARRFDLRQGMRLSRFAIVLAPCLVWPNETTLGQMPQGTGFWVVHGRPSLLVPCTRWTVRLAVEDNRLTGILSVPQGDVIIDNLQLRSDGAFSGSTPAGVVNQRSVGSYDIVGQFSGDLIRVTLSTSTCPRGSARRRATGY
jgi:hypothetical protein